MTKKGKSKSVAVPSLVHPTSTPSFGSINVSSSSLSGDRKLTASNKCAACEKSISRPLRFPCSHPFCISCAVGMFRVRGNGDNPLECPFCDAKFPLSGEEVMAGLDSLIEEEEIIEEGSSISGGDTMGDDSSATMCMRCEKRGANLSCIDCNSMNLCLECDKIVHLGPHYALHTRETLEGEPFGVSKSSTTESASNSINTCKIHPGETFYQFCTDFDCMCFVCPQCGISHDNNHKTSGKLVDLPSALSAIRNVLQEHMTALTTAISVEKQSLGHVTRLIDNLRNERRDVVAKVRDATSKLMAMMIEKQRALVEEVEDTAKTKEDAFEDEKLKLIGDLDVHELLLERSLKGARLGDKGGTRNPQPFLNFISKYSKFLVRRDVENFVIHEPLPLKMGDESAPQLLHYEIAAVQGIVKDLTLEKVLSGERRAANRESSSSSVGSAGIVDITSERRISDAKPDDEVKSSTSSSSTTTTSKQDQSESSSSTPEPQASPPQQQPQQQQQPVYTPQQQQPQSEGSFINSLSLSDPVNTQKSHLLQHVSFVYEGSVFTFKLQICNVIGDVVDVKGVEIEVNTRGPKMLVFTKEYIGKGKYLFSVKTETSGRYLINIQRLGQHFHGSPFYLDVKGRTGQHLTRMIPV